MSNKTCVQFETAQKIKEFLGDTAPEPITQAFYAPSGNICRLGMGLHRSNSYPAYTLLDILSKPFCEAMSFRWARFNLDGFVRTGHGTARRLLDAYYTNGMPALENALMIMMEKKS